MIRTENLCQGYGEAPVLDGPTFRVDRGERVALLGRNGAGKTTLLRCLLGLVPFEGDVHVDGFDVGREGRSARERIGYVPQRAPVSDLALGEFVALVAGLRGTPTGEVRASLARLGLDLEREASKPLRALSGGMMQKTLLALALAAEAPLLLLDEPTGNLDPEARALVLESLNSVEPDTTIVLASHRLADVQAVARRILVLHDRTIAYDGPVSQLRDRAPAVWAAGARTEEELLNRLLERLAREGAG